MTTIQLYLHHINPDAKPYEIHMFMSSYNLSAPWVPHYDPKIQASIVEERRKRREETELWILRNSKIKPNIKMNAKKAREIASDRNRKELNEQLNYIMNAIELRSSQGYFDCIYCQELKQETRDLLESEGYFIYTDPVRDGSLTYTIKW